MTDELQEELTQAARATAQAYSTVRMTPGLYIYF